MNTIASNNPGDGILVQLTGSAVVTGVLSKVTANNNNFGIFVNGGATSGASLNVTVADSEASNNANTGVEAVSLVEHAATAVVASNDVTGLIAVGNAILRVAHSVVTGNNTGVNTSGGGILKSFGDNDIYGNTNDNFGVLTTIPTH